MSSPDGPLEVRRCTECHGRFLPRSGPCPQCGSTSTEPEAVAPEGTVLAATEVMIPPPGWAAPHRLALVELEHQVRLLANVSGPLPEVGARVSVARDGIRFVVRAPG